MTGDAHPWIRGPLTIERAVLEQIHADALARYPSESCGFVSGPRSDPDLLTACTPEENEADKYHKLDPETFPRTSNTYFKMNELRAGRAIDASEQSDNPIKVIYHSHCDAGAYFSEEDAATFATNNILMWPCAFIVVSVMNGAVAETKLWVHTPGTNDFQESTLTVR